MMKRKIRLMFLSIAVSTCIGMLPIYETMSQKVHADTAECQDSACHEHELHEHALGDLLEGHTGQKSNLEQEYQEVVAQSGNISPMAVQSDNSCNTHSTSCGHGRENGFSSTFLSTGCRQWEGWSYGNLINRCYLFKLGGYNE